MTMRQIQVVIARNDRSPLLDVADGGPIQDDVSGCLHVIHAALSLVDVRELLQPQRKD